MHFLINPARGSTKRKRRRTRARVTVRRRRRSTSSKGGTVAKRRRRRRAVSSSAPRRRRRRRVRRNPGALASARRVRVNRRRRRRASVRSNPRRARRRFRRNPSLVPGGIVNNIMQGIKDGAAVVLGEVAARKVRGAVTGMLPAGVQAQVQTGMGKIALSIASSLVVSLVARRALPGQARVVTAGAFAETINCVLATTPIAPYLAAYPVRPRLNGGTRPGVGAWTGATLSAPAPRRVGVGAYPGMRSVGMPVSVGV